MKYAFVAISILLFSALAAATVNPCDTLLNGETPQAPLKLCFDGIDTVASQSERIVMEGSHSDDQCPEAEVTTCKTITGGKQSVLVCHILQYRNHRCWDDIGVAPYYNRDEYLVRVTN